MRVRVHKDVAGFTGSQLLIKFVTLIMIQLARRGLARLEVPAVRTFAQRSAPPRAGALAEAT